MCEKKNFNDAVIMNEESMFLCKENDGTYYWRPCTNTAVLFPTNIAAEEFLTKWNKENPSCRINGVRIATAPSEEGIPVCSKEGRNTTMVKDSETENDDESYDSWCREEIVDEIFERGLEDNCDVDEDSTSDLRQVLTDDDEAKQNEELVDEDDDDVENTSYDDMSRQDIIDLIFERGLEDECDVDEDSTADLRQVLIDFEDETDKDDDEKPCKPCEQIAQEALKGCEDKIKKAAQIAAMLKRAKMMGDRKAVAVAQMNLGKIKKELKEKTKDCEPSAVASIIALILG
jgi:hypothetical protein